MTTDVNCSYNCFAPVYIDITADTNHSFGTLSKVFFQIHKAKIELLSFSSKLLLHLSSFTFHKSKWHIIYINLLPNSVFEDPFHHFHSMFQQSCTTKVYTKHYESQQQQQALSRAVVVARCRL